MKIPGFLGICLLFGSSLPTVADEPACEPEKWQKAIASFEAADQKELPPKQGILFVGSSSIGYWDLPKSFPELGAINRGFGGSEICDSTHYAETLIFKHQPRIVVFYAGDNDVSRGKSAEQVHRDFLAFREKLFEALPETQLLYVAIKPSRARWKLAPIMDAANKLIAGECKQDSRSTFIDIWTPMLSEGGKPSVAWFVKDGLHLSEKGYELWNSLLKPHLKSDGK